MRHFWLATKSSELRHTVLSHTALPATAKSRLGKAEEMDGVV